MLKNVLAKGVNKLYWVTKDIEIREAEKTFWTEKT